MSNQLKIKVLLEAIDQLSKPFKAAVNMTKFLNKEMDETNKIQSKLKKQQEENIATINKYKKAINPLNAKIKETHQALSHEQKEFHRLQKAIQQTSNPSKQLIKQFKNTQKSLTKLRATQSKNIQKLKETRAGFKKAGVNVKSYQADQNKLQKDLDKTNKKLNKQRKALEKLNQLKNSQIKYRENQKALTEKSDRARNFGGKALAGTVGAGLTAKALLMPGLDFEKQMSAVQAKLRLDKTSKDFKDLVAQAKELGATTSYTAQEVGAGQEFLAMAGFKAEAIKASMGDMLNLAKASNTDLAQTADIASNIAGAFKVDVNKAGEMTRVADILAYTTTSANVDMQMLGDSMKYLAQAKGLNLSLEQAAAMAGMLGNVGIQGTQAGTTLSSMLNRLSAPASEGKKAMKALGLTFTDTGDNAKDFVSFLEQVADKTKNLGNAKKAEYLKAIFGKTAVSGMTELVNQAGEGKLKQYVASYKAINGSAAKMAKTMADNVSGELDSLNSALQGVGIELFQSIASDLRTVIKWFTNLLRAIGKWAKEHKEQAKLWLTVASAIGAVIGSLGVLALGYSFLISPIIKVIYAGLNLVKVFSKLIPVIIRLSAVLLTNPFGLIVVAIAAVVGAIYLLWNKCDWFRNAVISVRNSITSFLGGIWDNITSLATGGIGNFIATIASTFNPFAIIYNAFAKVVNWLGGDLPETLGDVGRNLFNKFLEKVMGAVKAVGDKVKSALGTVKSFFGFGDDEKTTEIKAIQENKTVQQATKIAQTAKVTQKVAPIMKPLPVNIDKRTPIRAKQKHQTVNAPMTNNLTINVENGDPKTIKQVVLQTFQELQLKQQAQARAALVDSY